MKWRRKTLLLKPETVYGSDSVPTGAANAILAFDVELTPAAHEAAEREPLRPYYGAAESVIGQEHVALNFSVEMTPSGAADTPAKWGIVPRICGMAETINGSVSVQYDPVSDGEESGSIYMNIDGTLHRITGFRGAASMTWEQGAVPKFTCQGFGLKEAIAAEALPTVDFTGWPAGRDVGKANTPTFTVHGHAAVMQSLSIEFGQAAAFRPRVNGETVEITDRKTTGTLTIDAPALATKDYFALSVQDPPLLDTLQLIHGAGAGNIVQLDAPKVQVLPPGYSDSDGLVGLEIELRFTPDAGDDELTITTK